VQEYFEIITSLVAQQPRLRPVMAEKSKDPAHDLDYLTNFERKFRKEGRVIYRQVWDGLAV
jgi:tRNA (guanine-N7-)-methyltransferase